MSKDNKSKSQNTSFGDFQQGMGHFSGEMSSIFTKIFGVIFIIGGIACIVLAFIPMGSSSKDYCDKNNPCLSPGEKCKENKCQVKKKRNYWFLLGAFFLIALGAFMIWYGIWYKKWVHKDRLHAQVGGTLMEAGLISNLFNR
jgi:hypothetical protein